jgi:gluconolactonase
VAAPVVVARGVPFGEMPVWWPETGMLVVPSVAAAAVLRVDPRSGSVDLVARTRGGPNGLVPVTTGGWVVCQNGGFDFVAHGLDVPGAVPYDPVEPGLQYVAADGGVRVLSTEGWVAPNNGVVDESGCLWVTDSGPYPPPETPCGRIWRWCPGGAPEVVAAGLRYPNGIARLSDDRIVVVEASGVVAVAETETGEWDWVVEDIGAHPDGLCVDADDRLYVASTIAGVTVVEDGRVVERLDVPGGLITSCCFGGPDNRTLFATDAIPGRILAWEGMPTPGLPVLAWSVPG